MRTSRVAGSLVLLAAGLSLAACNLRQQATRPTPSTATMSAGSGNSGAISEISNAYVWSVAGGSKRRATSQLKPHTAGSLAVDHAVTPVARANFSSGKGALFVRG